MADEEQPQEQAQEEQTTTVVVTQPSGGGAAILTGGDKEWSSGLCSCCEDVKSCCMAYFCMPCLVCRMAKNTGNHMCTGCAPGGVVGMRTQIRLSYGIQGDVCMDACTSHFCGPLSICQMARELQFHGIDV